MERRDFLRLSALAGSGAYVLGSSSCASLSKLVPAGSASGLLPADMDGYLAQIDAGMATIAGWSPVSAFPEYSGDREGADNLGRKSLRTMYMTAMFADLAPSAQLHPGMQDRIRASLPEMDDATSGMERFLASQTANELARLQLALRSPQNPAMQIFEEIDRHASGCGLSTRRRIQTRVLMTDAGWRLRNQPPALVVGESLGKVRKATATDVALLAQQDWIAGRVAEKVFWQAQQGTESGSAGGEPGSAGEKSLRRSRINRGAYLMGLGLVVGGASAAIAAAGPEGFVFGATLGAVLIIIGLITLLVGLATSSSARTRK